MKKIYAKKSLGQNFLINPKVAERIALESGVLKKDTVLEVGTGTGNLTKYLLSRARKVVAVEKDDNLFATLQEKFSKEVEQGSLILAHGDILDLNLSNYKLKAMSYKLVSNIPYNITGVLLKKFLSGKNQPKSMTLMVQREVAERITTQNCKESLLSISVKAYGQPKILFKVGKGNFFPAPKVDSAVIRIENISKNAFIKNKIKEEAFWKILRAGFAHKRKKLASNLKKLVSKEVLNTLKNKRAEELELSDWIDLVKN